MLRSISNRLRVSLPVTHLLDALMYNDIEYQTKVSISLNNLDTIHPLLAKKIYDVYSQRDKHPSLVSYPWLGGIQHLAISTWRVPHFRTSHVPQKTYVANVPTNSNRQCVRKDPCRKCPNP